MCHRGVVEEKENTFSVIGTYLKHFVFDEKFSEQSNIYIRIHVKYLYYCLLLMAEFFVVKFPKKIEV